MKYSMPFLVLIVSISSGCFFKPIVIQKTVLPVDKQQFEDNLKNVSTKLHLNTEKVNDSTFNIIKPQMNPWDQIVNVQLAANYKNDSTYLFSKGYKVVMGPYGSQIGKSANDFAYMVNDALDQEHLFALGKKKYDTVLPHKSWGKFLALNLINPGLGAYYGYSTPMSGKSDEFLGTFFGLLDLGYISLLFMDDTTNPDGSKTSNKAIGALGIITFRSLLVFAFGMDMSYYRKIQDSGYYFHSKYIDETLPITEKYNF